MTFRPDFGRYRLAVWALALALAGCSPPAPKIAPLVKAQRALTAGDGVGAEIVLRSMLDRGTPVPQVAAYLGEAELLQDRLPDARQWLESGDFSAETHGLGFQMLGRLEMREGNLLAAGKAFDEALQSVPKSAELWVDIGRLRYQGGEQSQAVEASIHAVELGPQDPVALQFRAQLVRDSQGMETALPLYRAALKQNPDDLKLLGDYAATLGELGHAHDMLAVIRHMIELDGSNPQAFYLQAVLAARGGYFDLAGNLLARSGELERGTPAAMLLSAIVDLESGNFESAAQTLDLLAGRQPDNARVRLLLARALFLGGNYRELIHRFGDRALVAGAPPYLAALVGRAYEALGQRSDAAQYLDFAAQPRMIDLTVLPPSDPLDVAQLRGTQTGADTVTLVRAYMASDRAAPAVTAAQNFLARVPGSADALGLAGDAHLFAAQPREALADYKNAAVIRQPWPLTRRIYATLVSLGDSGAAIDLLRHQLTNDPANCTAATLLGSALVKAGRAEEARRYLDLAVANGARRDPHVLALRAQAALFSGDERQALSDARKAYELQPMSGEVTATLAQVLEQTGSGPALVARLRQKIPQLPPAS